MMATVTITQITSEPEEAIETALVAILAQSVTIPVEGFLTPATTGTEKRLAADTFVSVQVDQSSQDLDFMGANVPHTYAARVTVHYAQADDADGSSFRDECRKCRSALLSLTGDGCENLGASGFDCDAFILDSTSSSFEAGENPTSTKAYAVTLKGRVTSTTTEA